MEFDMKNKVGAPIKYDIMAMAVGDIIVAEDKSTKTMVSLINHRLKYIGVTDRKYTCRRIGNDVHIVRIL
jgi:hypothetical protein